MPVSHGKSKGISSGCSVRERNQLTKKEVRSIVITGYETNCEMEMAHGCRLAGMDYPLNPNGSIDAVAGICDETGRIMGMMPHPEVYLHRTNYPRWTREELPEEDMGLAFFVNAVQYIRNHLL